MIAHRDAGPDDRRPHTVYADKPARCQSYMERLKQVWLFDLIWGRGRQKWQHQGLWTINQRHVDGEWKPRSALALGFGVYQIPTD
ncbi:hypothetical protein PISMIDRAFT_677736 [Pisolithus microcarpus 441]|uniref:Uncharacterized protein n=1 Tax=Pisolithus microcarpus 441 TaxID=765257 RepID=A0A0C9YIS0_9AGAM|nr:hypothetical protein PISMIDRAFT_677736 [Pisolithus microcarpus 441]